MSAYLLLYGLILISIIALVSGVYLLGGLGWALIALSIEILGLTYFLSKGLTNGE